MKTIYYSETLIEYAGKMPVRDRRSTERLAGWKPGWKPAIPNAAGAAAL